MAVAAARPQASYLLRHWRGELSLPLSYWINGWLANLSSAALSVAVVLFATPERSTVLAAMASTAAWLYLGVALVWQFVGVWRSAGHHTERGGSAFWAGAAKIIVMIGWVTLFASLVTRGGPQVVEFWRIAAGDSKMGPHFVRVLRGGTELEYFGGITFGVTAEVRKVLDAEPHIRVIHLNSQGGRVAEARELRALIRERELVTYTATLCASACTIAFMGGRERYMNTHARIGFHAGSFPGLSEGSLAIENQREREALLGEGVPQDFVDRALSTPNTELWYPTKDELLKAHIITAVARPDQFALSGNGDPSPETVDRELVTVPIFAALKKAAPAVYGKIAAVWLKALQEGRTETEVSAETIPAIRAAALASAARAGDGPVVDFAEAIADSVEAVGTKDAARCYAMLHPGAGGPDAGVPMAQGYGAAATAVMQSAAADPQPLPAAAEVAAPLARVRGRMIETYGEAAVSEYERGNTAFCGMAGGWLRAVLALPPGDRERVLRFAFAKYG